MVNFHAAPVWKHKDVNVIKTCLAHKCFWHKCNQTYSPPVHEIQHRPAEVRQVWLVRPSRRLPCGLPAGQMATSQLHQSNPPQKVNIALPGGLLHSTLGERRRRSPDKGVFRSDDCGDGPKQDEIRPVLSWYTVSFCSWQNVRLNVLSFYQRSYMFKVNVSLNVFTGYNSCSFWQCNCKTLHQLVDIIYTW